MTDNRDQLTAVSKMQKYIEENISENITLYSLSRVAGYSPWHSARLFKKYTGRTPFAYIRALRLSKAAVTLRNGKSKVMDVALDFVFDSHEGFTRAFSREFGVNPKNYIKENTSIKLFMPNSVIAHYKELRKGAVNMDKIETPATVFVQVIERPERKMILKRGKKAKDYYEYCEEVGCDVWNVLSSIKEALYEPMGLWLPKNMIKMDTSEYAQGVEVAADYKGEVPSGFEIINLKPCKMMIFQGPPFNDEEFESAILALWKVIKSYNPSIYGFEYADEIAPRFQLEPQGYRGYIEGKPVRSIEQ